MTLTDEAIEALKIQAETRCLLLACIKEPTPKKLVKANMHFTQRLFELHEVSKLVEELIKQDYEDLKDIVRLENV